MITHALLQAIHLNKYFSEGKAEVRAVNDVDLTILWISLYI